MGAYHYPVQSRLTVTQPVVEYPNDFALWAATALQDSSQVEKLSSFDPFDYDHPEQVREAMVDILAVISVGFAYCPLGPALGLSFIRARPPW